MLFQNWWFLQHGILFCPWEERELPGCSFFIFKFRLSQLSLSYFSCVCHGCFAKVGFIFSPETQLTVLCRDQASSFSTALNRKSKHTTDGQYSRVGRPSRGENRRHCPSIHAQPRPMERLVNTRHWRGKTDTGPIEELPFFKVRSLNLHLQRFFCRSLVDKITFFLLRCPALPCLSLLLPYPAPQILSREKSAAPSIPAMWGPHVMNLWCWEWVGG